MPAALFGFVAPRQGCASLWMSVFSFHLLSVSKEVRGAASCRQPLAPSWPPLGILAQDSGGLRFMKSPLLPPIF